MSERAIIIAAGDATRWGNHLGVPKHFVEVDGEKIIERTVRQLRSHGITDIHVVGPDPSYQIPGSRLFVPTKNKDNADLDKFMNSRELWNPYGKTFVLYGDVYFTDDAMRWILTHDKPEFTLHCRPFNSNLTGTEWGECFCLSFYPRDHKMLNKVFDNLLLLYREDKLKRLGGWEVYKGVLNRYGLLPVEKMHQHWVTGHNLNAINDWTDDFDYPEDYDRFIKLRKEAGL